MNQRSQQVPSHPGPARTVMLGAVARQFFLQSKSKVEIAENLGLSRFKVARLIDEAVSSGLVTIHIAEDDDFDVASSMALQEKFQLRRALVLQPGRDSEDAERARLARLAARWLEEDLAAGEVLGLPWSRTIYAMIRSVDHLPPVQVVQLCGALDSTGQDANAVEVVVHASRLAGTQGKVFYAPLIVADKETARALRAQRPVQEALAASRQVTRAVVGIGSWSPGNSTVYDSIDPVDREEASAHGVVGEVCGVFFDAEGRPVTPPLCDRIISISASDFVALPDVTAVASGAAKSEAVATTARGGLIHGLVVDATLAQALLAE